MFDTDLRRLWRSGLAGISLVRGMSGLGRVPLFVSWNITFRCNLRCAYCGASDAPRRELDTDGICAGLGELYRLGGRWVTFGGGEPLVRPDMGILIQHAKTLGFQVFLSTNGRFVPDRIGELRHLDNVNLSLDGPREVHDAVRGEGAFDWTLRAVEAIKQAKVPFSFQCTLGTHNLENVEEATNLARELGAWIMFQPATQWLDSSTSPNPVAAPGDGYRKAMDRLLELKRAGAPIANSKAGLRHLAKWPEPASIRCLAGRLAVIVEPDGTLLSCHQCEVGRFLEAREESKTSLTSQFRNTPPPRGCSQCWCAPVVELALIASLKPEALWNTFRRFF